MFPTYLKVGWIKPIFKSGKKYQPKTYRTNTTLPVLAEVFENLLHKRMMDLINKFIILNSKRFGFIPDHNLSDALLEFLDNAYEVMNKNKVLLAIFLDFSKVFHKVDNQIILRKLEFYGFRDKNLQWLGSFLNTRIPNLSN